MSELSRVSFTELIIVAKLPQANCTVGLVPKTMGTAPSTLGIVASTLGIVASTLGTNLAPWA